MMPLRSFIRKANNRICLLLLKSPRFLLQKLFRFDSWHLRVLNEKPYAKEVIRYLNSRPTRREIVEIGCGLGDIISRTEYESRIGLDSDKPVLRAARALALITLRRRIKFLLFEFPNDRLQGQFDVIVMVNWIHGVANEVMARKVKDYFENNLHTGGCIIVDTVEHPNYKYNHKIEELSTIVGSVVEKVAISEVRLIWAIRKPDSKQL